MNEEKKTKQSSFEEYIDAVEKQLKDGFKGLITEINPITNTLYFDSKGLYDEKEGYAVVVKIHDGTNGDIEFSQWFSKPSAQGYTQSNVFKFKKKYNSVFKKGLAVDCYIDDNGFYRIDF